MLGGEDDIVIALLGKEWSDNSHDDEGLTIYFREPENLNVQFSRHRLMLIVIGDIQRLRNTAAKIVQAEEAQEKELRRNQEKGLKRNRIIDKNALKINALRIHRTLNALFNLAEIEHKGKQLMNLPSKKVSNHAVFVRID
jgi:hypothetical protein